MIAASTDDGFFGMQNVLAKSGWQSAVASSEEEAEERFVKLWPHLIIIDARKTSNKQQKSSFSAEHVIRYIKIIGFASISFIAMTGEDARTASESLLVLGNCVRCAKRTAP